MRCGSRASPARTSASSSADSARSIRHCAPEWLVETAGDRRPVRLVVRDDLERSRLTVFFRLILAIPSSGCPSRHRRVAGFVNCLQLIQAEVLTACTTSSRTTSATRRRVGGYVFLAANPYPWFRVQQDYPVDVEIDPPVRQGRWGGFFRLLLAVPALVLATALGGVCHRLVGSELGCIVERRRGGALVQRVAHGGGRSSRCLPRVVRDPRARKAPRGLRDVTAFALGYAAQAGAYLFLLTPRYPTSDPKLAEPYADLPEHPVRIVVDDDSHDRGSPSSSGSSSRSPTSSGSRSGRSRSSSSDSSLGSSRSCWGACRIRCTASWPPTSGTPRTSSRSSASSAAAFRLHGARRPARDRHRDRSADASEPVEDAVPLLPRDPGVHPRERARRRRVRDCAFRLVAGARDRADAGGDAEPRAACLRYSAQTYAYFLLVTSRYPYGGPILRAPQPTWDGPLLMPSPAPPLVGDAFQEPPSPRSSSQRSRSGRSCSIRPPPTISRRRGRRGRALRSDFVAEAKRYERVFYVLWALAQIALLLTLWVYSRRGCRVRTRASRGRSAPGCSSGCSGWGSSGSSICPRGRGALVDATQRPIGVRLRRLAVRGLGRARASSSPSASPCSS